MKLALLSLLTIASCASLKSFIHAGKTHQKMGQRLENHTYSLPMANLKAKVVEFIAMDHESPTIVLPATGSNPADGLKAQHNKQNRVDDALRESGYSYHGKTYVEELTVDWQGLLSSQDSAVQKFKTQLKTGPYNIVEDTPQKFVIVKGAMVYTGEAVGEGMSKLSAQQLSEVKYDTAQWRMNWGDLFDKKLGFSLDRGPVSLEKSLPTAQRDVARELSLLHFLDKEKFLTWEREASL